MPMRSPTVGACAIAVTADGTLEAAADPRGEGQPQGF
jgi:gamma-glutamyltranspeptidase